MKDQIERRVLNLEGCELRADEVEGKTKIRGYAARFNTPSELMWDSRNGKFREFIAPGAFRETIERRDDVYALLDHDPSKILGRQKAGTLRMIEDEIGLRVEIDPPDTATGNEVIANLRAGNLDKMSFKFKTAKGDDEWRRAEDGISERTLKRVSLMDVSIVAFPAYPDTSVAVRSAQEAMPEPDADTGDLELAEARLKLVG